MLNKNSWSDENYKYLSELIEKYKSDENTEKYKRNYAVTDWDNTSAAFDIQENTVLYQILSLSYACNPDEFKEAIWKELTEDDFKVDTRLLLEDILKDYKYLYERKLKADLLKEDLVYKDFVAKFSYFMYVFVNSLDYGRSARKFLHFFYKMTEDQLRDLTRSALAYFKDYEKYRLNFSFSLGDKKTIDFDYKVGLREIKEQVDLFKNIRDNNIDLYICSASSMVLVEEFASSKLFSYSFKKEDVIGLMQKKDEDGKFTLDFEEENLTYLEGKASYIKKLEELYKKPPILYMGDSIGDYYALTYLGLKCGLVFKDPESKSFYKLKEKLDKQDRQTVYLYQDKDPETGLLSKK